jgi:hypothetical protein
VLLALVSAPWNNALDTMVIPKSAIGGKPLIPTSWLMPAGDGNSLHFKLKRPERAAGGAGAVATAAKMRLIPYYEVQEELFVVYPSVPISLATSSAAVAPSHDYPKSYVALGADCDCDADVSRCAHSSVAGLQRLVC